MVTPGYTDPSQFVAGNPYGASHTSNNGETAPDDVALGATALTAKRAVRIGAALKRAWPAEPADRTGRRPQPVRRVTGGPGGGSRPVRSAGRTALLPARPDRPCAVAARRRAGSCPSSSASTARPSGLSTDSGWNCTPAKAGPRSACTAPSAGSRASSTGPYGGGQPVGVGARA